jgi:hypothetical protein
MTFQKLPELTTEMVMAMETVALMAEMALTEMEEPMAMVALMGTEELTEMVVLMEMAQEPDHPAI